MSPGRPLGPEALAAALERIEDALQRQPVLEALVARREAGAPDPEDEARAAALVAALCARVRADGSWNTDLVSTAENLLLLRDLAPAPDPRAREVASAACAWLLQRRGLPGGFGAGCDPSSHEAGLCEHFMNGLFSPADPGIDLRGTMLVTGARFPSDAAARFAGSCLALRAIVAWSGYGPDLEDGLGSLRSVVMRHTPAHELPGCAGYACAVAALGEVRDSEPDRVAALAGLARLAAAQRADGSWPGVDLFHVLETLTAPSLAWLRLEPSRSAIHRAAGMLALMIGPDGAWGLETGPVRTLIGWRTLRRALADSIS